WYSSRRGSLKCGGAFAAFSTCGRFAPEAPAAKTLGDTHMTDRTFNPTTYSARRRSLLIAAGATLATPLAAHAQASGEDIVIGGSIPMTGVFAFAGVGIDAGMKDYVKMVNDAGGI